MSANFSPSFQPYTNQGAFRYWCQTVLPLVYDDSLSYYELLNKVVVYLNNTIADVSAVESNVDALHGAYDELEDYVNEHIEDVEALVEELQEFVNDYFTNLDVQNEIDHKLDEMATDGSLATVISPLIPTAVATWLSENITPTTPVVDETLSISGAAADAKVTGDRLANADKNIDDVGNVTVLTDQLTYGKYINTNPSGLVINPAGTSADGYACGCFECSPGDVFTFTNNSTGTNSYHRSYCFCDSEYNRIETTTPDAANDVNKTVVAPSNASYFIFNAKLSSPYYVVKGTSYGAFLNVFSNFDANTLTYRRTLTENDDLDEILDNGFYAVTSTHRPANYPPTNYGGFLAVYKSVNRNCQVAFTDGGNGGTTKIFVRIAMSANSWTAWTRFADTTFTDALSVLISNLETVFNDSNTNASWTNGGINSSGNASSSSTHIRSGYVNIESFIYAKCNDGGRFDYYCYDAGGAFIAKVNASSARITVNDVLSQYAATKYVRFVFSLSSGADVSVSDIDTYGIMCQCNTANYAPLNQKALTSDILFAKLDSDNKLTDNYRYNWYVELNDEQDMVLEILAKSGGDTLATIELEIFDDYENKVFNGPPMSIDKTEEYRIYQMRLPNGFFTRQYRLIFSADTSNPLYVKNFKIFNDNLKGRNRGIIFEAHRGLDYFYPPDSYVGMVAAGEMGFKYCITIPKFTSDGVGVCFHNDGGSSSPISAQLTNPDGSPIEEINVNTKISDLSYQQLLGYSIGAFWSPYFADCKILTLDDYFFICAKYDMHPVLSIHPDLTAPQVAYIKNLTDKYNLSDKLSIKTGDNSNWQKVIAAYGDGVIERIICLEGASSTWNMLNAINNGKTAAGITNTRVDGELFIQGLKADTTAGAIQRANLTECISNGIHMSCVLEHQTSTEVIKSYINQGVTEFTNGKQFNINLNW